MFLLCIKSVINSGVSASSLGIVFLIKNSLAPATFCGSN